MSDLITKDQIYKSFMVMSEDFRILSEDINRSQRVTMDAQNKLLECIADMDRRLSAIEDYLNGDDE